MSYEQTQTECPLECNGGQIYPITEDDIVCINICGFKFETLRSTLERFPSTLLGNEELRAQYYIESKQAYFFDRNRKCFEAILYYYQSNGILIRPNDIPMQSFVEEVNFYGIEEEALMRLRENEGYIPDAVDIPSREGWKMKIWTLFEHPDSSIWARCLACWSIFVIIVSITAFCMETMPIFKSNTNATAKILGRNVSASTLQHDESEALEQPWFSLELFCIIWFTFEYFARFVCSPSKFRFVWSTLNTIDLLAILPYYISTLINQQRGKTTLSVLRIVRLVRVFRVFKLSRHSIGLQVLGETLRASVGELGMLAFFLALGVILFSSGIYFAEHGENDMFTSIPDTFWYSIVTMTTVGYGDKVPKTTLGKIIGSLCAVSGVLTIALPVPVIVSNFEFFYKRDRFNKGNTKNSSQTSLENAVSPCPEGYPSIELYKMDRLGK